MFGIDIKKPLSLVIPVATGLTYIVLGTVVTIACIPAVTISLLKKKK